MNIIPPSRRFTQRLVSSARALLPLLALAALAVSSQALAQVQLPSGPPYTTVSPSNAAAVAIGDMNSDGNEDVVIGVAGTQKFQIVLGDGQGGFGTPMEFPAFPSSLTAKPGSVVLGDVNHDGKLDVVALDYATSGALSVLFGDGAGNLGTPTVYNFFDTRNPGDTRYVVWSAALADVNSDGKSDLIVGAANNFFSSKGDVWVLLNDGSGNFATPTAATIVWTRFMGHGDGPAGFVAGGDLDGDGNGDIVVTSGFGQFGSGNAVTVLYGNGTGAFASTVGMPFPLTPNGRANQAQGVVIADLDGDGLPDLVVSASDIGGTRTGGVTVFRSTGSRTFDAGTTYPTLFFRNGMAAVGDLSGDGHPDVVVTGATSGDSLAYLLNDGSGGLGAAVYVPGLAVAYRLALGDLTSSGPGTLDIVVGTLTIGTQLLQNGPAGPPADTTPPVITAPANITDEATGPSGAVVTFTATANDDVDGPVSVTANPPSGSTFPLGTTIVGLSAADAAGNTATGSFTITVLDTTAPVISSVTASSATLWPPNHKMVPITLAVAASDAVGLASLKIISATSNEPDNGLGDGDTAGDIEIMDAFTLKLRAERSGSGNGRVYTITVEAKDAAGNATTRTVTVSVPKSQGK